MSFLKFKALAGDDIDLMISQIFLEKALALGLCFMGQRYLKKVGLF